jgi:hypothetical protein
VKKVRKGLRKPAFVECSSAKSYVLGCGMLDLGLVPVKGFVKTIEIPAYLVLTHNKGTCVQKNIKS